MEVKKTLGRRKIQIKKIENKNNRQVTYSKRRHGLFRKASELAILCGAEVAIVVQSPSQKVFTFAHPSVEALIGRVMMAPPRIIGRGDCGYEEAIKTLEAEKSTLDGGGFWWEAPFEGFDLHQLEEFSAALEGLRDNVAARVAKFQSFTVDSAAAQVQDFSAAASVQEFSVAPSIQEFSAAASVQELSVTPSIQEFSAAASVQELSVIASTQEFSGAAYSAAAAIQEFSAAASFQELGVVASTQEFSSAAFSASASVQEFSGAAYSASASVQEFSGAAYSASAAAIQEFSGADHSSAASFQEFSGADHSTAASFQEFSVPASASHSSYLSQPFDQDQDFLFDISELFEGLDEDQDLHDMMFS